MYTIILPPYWCAVPHFYTRSVFSPVYLWMCRVYLAALFPQMPPKRDEAALQEEEELQLAIALSQSEAEEKERMVRRARSPLFLFFMQRVCDTFR